MGVHRTGDLGAPEPSLYLMPLEASPNNLPVQLSSFVGRDADIVRGSALLVDTRLLTLTGVGGCGKTRLALQIASGSSGRFPGGVWWVELASVADSRAIGHSVAASVGERVPPEKQAVDVVADIMGTQPSLLVLDNCEHLINGVAEFVDRLLRRNPVVSVMATSREPLGIEGEVTWRVPPLAQHDSVSLFLERARQVAPDFRIANENGPLVTQICDRLDGLPLAIELAAARTAVLPLERIAAGLDDRFRFLTGKDRVGIPRQQTLLASVGWSHELLDDRERASFRRLAVFAGGFTLEAAEAVASFEPLTAAEVLDGVTHLVDKSLVQMDSSHRGPARYQLLETIRDYALERLTDAGETSASRDRHFQWMSGLSGSLENAVTNAQPAALDQLDAERANLNAAMEWAVDGGELAGARRLVRSVGFFWAQRGHYADAAYWEAKIFDGAESADPSVGRARWTFAYVHFYAGDVLAAYEQASTALEEARTAGDDSTTARCLHTVGTALLAADPVGSRTHLVEAVDLARSSGDEWCLADALQILAYTYLLDLDHRKAEQILAEAYPICDRVDNDFQRSWHHTGMAWAAMLRAEFNVAAREIDRAMKLARRVGDPAQELRTGSILASILQEQGRPAELAREVAVMRAERREWGAFGETLLAAFDAVAAMADEPSAAAAELDAVGMSFLEAGDALDSTYVLICAAMAYLEAAELEKAASSAATIEEWGPTGYKARARLLRAVAIRSSDPGRAADLVHDALAELVAHDVVIAVPLALETLGGLAADDGAGQEAARLLAAAESLRQVTSQSRLPGEQRRFVADAATARELLGEQFEEVWSDGSRLSGSDAAAYAGRSRGERKRPQFGWDSLTPTEREVVSLAVQGLTNPEIGKRLLMGRGTVKTHLSHVYAKLGVRTRTELAGVAAQRTPRQSD